LGALRDHAVQLSRDFNNKLLQSLSEGQLPETVKAPRRQALLNKFHSLMPGSTNSALAFIVGDDGEVITDKTECANLLTKYWQLTFDAKPINEDKLEAWLIDLPKMQFATHQWRPTLEHIENAIKFAHPSSAGPDGIPYSAYAKFEGSALILFEALNGILSDQPMAPPEDFNWAFLCCLPKKPVRVDPRLGTSMTLSIRAPSL